MPDLALSTYHRFCMKLPLFKNLGAKMAKSHPEIESIMAKANKNILGEVHYTSMLVTIVLSTVGAFLFSLLFNVAILIPMGAGIPIRVTVIFVVTVITPIVVYFLFNFLPRNKMTERKKKLDRNLSYATNYMAAMASADVTPSSIFRGLAQQEIYGEVQVEAEKIARDVDFFGKDLVKVLQKAIARSPSDKFQDFLQGIITTANSGGSLKVYFMSKSEQFMRENRIQQEKDLQTLGVMAESFVTVVVAAPLFLIIMMSTMAMMGQKGGEDLLMATIFLLIPVMQLVFGVLIGDTGGGD